MLPTLMVEAVMPVWSLKALEGIVPRLDAPALPVPPVVVVVEAELVELQATAVMATNTTSPNAAMRVFHAAEAKAPP
jgi:hypothetical protein